MSTIDTGRYRIVNVKWSNLAYLPDPNSESAVVGNDNTGSAGEQWNVSKLSNGKYTIRSQEHSSYASATSRPSQGDGVVGGTREKQWVIKEARVRGQYTRRSISPSDGDVFWGLEDGEPMTPIAMFSTPNDTKNQWRFEK
ncbi:hypothetical protein FRC10_002017 [Ceratobasidium sp. 414]|nr:hypothetical protein FRC10_002017 [Ceratobasidium sp. 414]